MIPNKNFSRAPEWTKYIEFLFTFKVSPKAFCKKWKFTQFLSYIKPRLRYSKRTESHIRDETKYFLKILEIPDRQERTPFLIFEKGPNSNPNNENWTEPKLKEKSCFFSSMHKIFIENENFILKNKIFPIFA